MSGAEIVIGLLGLFVGWWVVSSLIRPAAKPSQAAAPADASAGAQPWHQVLGVLPEASVDEIRAAWRALVSQYHPDKVASLGAEFQAIAERKTQAINVAYREGLRARGASDA